MRLLAVVQEPEDYEAWLDGARRKPAATPTSPEAIAGEQTFEAGPCSMCHQVRGTISGGRVAPDLTHFRQPPAAGLEFISQQHCVSGSVDNARPVP
jgi:cytochrome c oxidase subunit 2